jgi:hypothetical protein
MLPGKCSSTVISALLLLLPALVAGQSNPFTSYDVQPGAGCTILIRWEAPAAADTLNYEIERSTDGQNWKVISCEHRRSNHKYLVFDTQTVDSLNYYRVRQVINLNTSVYSQVKCIQFVRAFEIYLWPNPANEVLYVTTPFLSGTMDIFDTSGFLVRKIIIVDFTTAISTIGLPEGVYFLHIRHADLYTVQRFLRE